MKNSKADIVWTYQYILGRRPENALVMAHHSLLSDLRGEIYSSPERKGKGLTYFAPDDFCVWRPNTPKIAIVSSCQGPALARSMAALSNVSVFGGAVVKTKQEPYAAQLKGLLDTADHILIADLTDNWGYFSQQNLIKTYGDKVKTYHRPFFEALHPDQTYPPPSAGQSPIGDYHSRIIIQSYLNGLSEEQCLARFSADEYRRIGFVEIAQRAMKKLAEKDARVDVKIGDYIADTMKDQPLFYTINHPTQVLQNEIARRYLELIGIACGQSAPLLIPTVLAQGPIWPVDSAWAEVMELNYHTGDHYWHNNYMMSREEYIHRSYRMYRVAPRNHLAQAVKDIKL